MGWIRCTGIPGWNVCDISMADRSPRVRYLSHWKFIYAERYIGSILLSSCAHCSHKHMCVRRDRAHGWPRPLYSYSNRSTQTHIIDMILFCFYALSLFLFFSLFISFSIRNKFKNKHSIMYSARSSSTSYAVCVCSEYSRYSYCIIFYFSSFASHFIWRHRGPSMVGQLLDGVREWAMHIICDAFVCVVQYVSCISAQLETQ